MRNIRHTIGNTPIVKISDHLYGKLETYNPAGSVKDRMVSYVIQKAQLYGDIRKDTILCDATSGNTGIALSMLGASLGLSCVIFMPRNMSEERKQMMKIYGAKIIDAPDDDFTGAITLRDAFLASNPRAWSPMQFSNRRNVECHFYVTGPEIHKQTIALKRPWEAFIHGSGTGGTIEGIRRYIVYNKLNTKVCMVKPDSSPHGIQGIADGKEFLAKEADMDEILSVGTDEAIQRAKRFARDTGLLVGISAGANIIASERWIAKNNPSGNVITMLCDRGERYMSIYDKN